MMIAEKDSRRRGLASEALRLLMAYAATALVSPTKDSHKQMQILSINMLPLLLDLLLRARPRVLPACGLRCTGHEEIQSEDW